MTQAVPQSSALETTWQDRALAHLWLHSDDLEWPEATRPGGLPVFESGDGAILRDVHGKSYIDGMGGLAVVTVGHGRREIAEAMAKQASALAYTSASTATNTASIRLAEKLAAITPAGLERVFFCSGGSEAVESAVKIAKQLQVLRGFPKRSKVIARRGSYHGTTGGAMALTASASERYFSPFAPGATKIPSPNHYRPNFSDDPVQEDLACARALEQEILAQGPETVAAFIAEPISLSNGTHIPTKQYWTTIREICDRHGVLLIMDEVITGFGRTGTMFAADQYVVPDLMTMAKGLSSGYVPVAAVVASPEVFEPFTHKGNALNHLLTFGGQAVAAAAALANIEIIEREQLVARSAENGAYLKGRLEQIAANHETIGDVRGVGLMIGVEFVKNRESRASWGSGSGFIQRLLELTRDLGLVTRIWDVMHLAPPLVIERDEIDRLVDIVDEALTKCESEFAEEIG